MRKMKINRSKSKRLFERTASRTHYKNIQDRPMRGGIRL